MRGGARKAARDLTDLARPTSAIAAAGSAWMSYLAYIDMLSGEDAAGLNATFTAGVMAVVCWTLLYGLNLSVFKAIIELERDDRRKLKLPILVVALLVAFFSTYTNVLTSASRDAIAIHREYDRAQLEGVAIDAQALGSSVGQLAAPLVAKAAELRQQANCEQADGCLTGAPGAGDLTRALVGAAESLDRTIIEVTVAQERISNFVPEVHAALQSGDPIQARGAIATMIAAVPFGSIIGAADRLGAGLGIRGTARSAELRKRQNLAIERIERELQVFAAQMKSSAQSIQSQLSKLEVPERQPLTKASAILKYWNHLLPQIAIGLALDWSIPMIALIIALIRDASGRGKFNSERRSHEEDDIIPLRKGMKS